MIGNHTTGKKRYRKNNKLQAAKLARLHYKSRDVKMKTFSGLFVRIFQAGTPTPASS